MKSDYSKCKSIWSLCADSFGRLSQSELTNALRVHRTPRNAAKFQDRLLQNNHIQFIDRTDKAVPSLVRYCEPYISETLWRMVSFKMERI